LILRDRDWRVTSASQLTPPPAAAADTQICCSSDVFLSRFVRNSPPDKLPGC